SDYPGRLYWTSAQMDAKPNIQHLIAPGCPYYVDLSHAIRDWTGVPMRIGSADALLGSVMLFMPEPRSRIVSLRREEDEDEIIVSLEVIDTAVKDLRLIGGWRDGEQWKSFDHLIISSGTELRLPVPRSAEELNLHLVGGDGRWYDYHLEAPGWNVGQERAL